MLILHIISKVCCHSEMKTLLVFLITVQLLNIDILSESSRTAQAGPNAAFGLVMETSMSDLAYFFPLPVSRGGGFSAYVVPQDSLGGKQIQRELT